MWIKICGITTVEDAATAVRAGANTIGLNFYEASQRYITPGQARLIANKVSKDVDVVICPPFTSLEKVHDLIKNTAIKLGAQNTNKHEAGAYTGEISPSMIKSIDFTGFFTN